jgi:hypothetical protein
MFDKSVRTVPWLAGLAVVCFLLAAIVPQLSTYSRISGVSGFFVGLGVGMCVVIWRIRRRRRIAAG